MAELELLAPAGTLETFFAAVEAGADAIYAGVPGFNARNLARDLRLEELGAMIDHCHALDKKFFVAANSQILEKELPKVIETLAILEKLQPDALIVQDMGLLRLVRSHFPTLKLHASTLMTAHNAESVQFLADLGCERVVLAREMTVGEIQTLAEKTTGVDLEVFIHGAMCFSYSGLCLFSSYLGGKSGLRGRCVQPCRRVYTTLTQGGKRGGSKKTAGRYLFSMNDLSGLEYVDSLRAIGVRSLKIEGRLRSAHYVRNVVRAYRLVLDSLPEEKEATLQQARGLVEAAMSRKTGPGFFVSPQPESAITPHHSGNIGTHLGKFSSVKKGAGGRICRFVTHGALLTGDRLRLQKEPGGGRLAFRVQHLFVRGEEKAAAGAGERVSLALPADFSMEGCDYVDVYKVDTAGGGVPGAKDFRALVEVARGKIDTMRHRLPGKIEGLKKELCADSMTAEPGATTSNIPPAKTIRKKPGKQRYSMWLRTDSPKLLTTKLPFAVDRFLLPCTRPLLRQAGELKGRLGKSMRKITWALPPIITDGDLARMKKQVEILLRTGFRSFQVAHLSQVAFFRGEKVQLCADYSVNLFNSQAVAMAREQDIECCQLAIELDKASLQEVMRAVTGGSAPARPNQSGRNLVGLSVYGAPPLFTARLASPHFPLNRQIASPKNETYVIRKEEHGTKTYPDKPFSLLPYLDELAACGINYFVIDISGTRTNRRSLEELGERVNNTGRYAKLPTFNYLGNVF